MHFIRMENGWRYVKDINCNVKKKKKRKEREKKLKKKKNDNKTKEVQHSTHFKTKTQKIDKITLLLILAINYYLIQRCIIAYNVYDKR